MKTRIFSDVALHTPGMRRSIVVVSRPGDDPALIIQAWKDGERINKVLVHRRDRDALVNVTGNARAGRVGETFTTPGHEGTVLCFEATVDDGPGVRFWRRSVEGPHLTQGAHIHGREFVDFERAVFALVNAGKKRTA